MQTCSVAKKLFSVALWYVFKLVEDGEIDFINTRLPSGDKDTDDVPLDRFFRTNARDYSTASFKKGWGLRAGYGKYIVPSTLRSIKRYRRTIYAWQLRSET